VTFSEEVVKEKTMLRDLYSVFDPEVILVRSDLTPDMNELIEILKEDMDEKHIPDLIYVRDVSEYQFLGTMLFGVYGLQQNTIHS
ncbi:MAG: hypothetical protein IJ679_05050, partial [Lachnospiraceae bacterium]|nr:hypothetical protein [Lachnospiraceae bacterium]